MRNRIALVLSAMLIGGLLAGLTTSASGADPGATTAKKKKKVCPAGTHKVTVKKKNGKKKKKCVADTPTTPTPATTLTISPGSFTYPTIMHNSCNPPPDMDTDCTQQAFTVTNTGGPASGVPAITIAESNPGNPGFVISANTCTAALSVGGTCTVTIYFKPVSEGTYTAVLHAAASPGGDATASLSGETAG